MPRLFRPGSQRTSITGSLKAESPCSLTTCRYGSHSELQGCFVNGHLLEAEFLDAPAGSACRSRDNVVLFGGAPRGVRFEWRRFWFGRDGTVPVLQGISGQQCGAPSWRRKPTWRMRTKPWGSRCSRTAAQDHRAIGPEFLFIVVSWRSRKRK